MNLSRPRRLTAWLMMLFSLPVAQGADLTLSQALEAARQYSAALAANQHQINALENMAESATQLPDPKLKFGIENAPIGGNNGSRLTREPMTMQRIGIMQDYISIAKRKSNATALHTEAAKTAATAQMLLAQLQRDTAQTWLDLNLIQRAEKQAQKLLKEATLQVPLQTASVSNGNLPSNILEARLILIEIQNRVSDIQRDAQVAQARLVQLTGQSEIHIQGPIPHYQRLPEDNEVLIGSIPQHPEVLQAKRESEVANARAQQSALAAIPNVGIELYYGKRGNDYEDMAGVMVTVDLPLFKSQRQDKVYAADISRTQEAQQQLSLIERDRRLLLETLIAQYQAVQIRWQRQQQEVVPLQQQKTSLLTAQYRAGSSSLPEMINSRLTLLESELNTLNIEREMARLWAEIHYLIPQESSS